MTSVLQHSVLFLTSVTTAFTLSHAKYINAVPILQTVKDYRSYISGPRLGSKFVENPGSQPRRSDFTNAAFIPQRHTLPFITLCLCF